MKKNKFLILMTVISIFMGVFIFSQVFAAIEIAPDLGGGHTHSYSSATCTRPATCSCGATRGSALDHSPGDWVVTSSPTCVSKGYRRKYCTRCGNSVAGEQIAINASLHDNVVAVTNPYAVAPTCTTNGTANLFCNSCQKYTGETKSVSKLGHSWGGWSSNDDTHWIECGRSGCGATTSSGSHTDSDDDGYCDTCGRLLYLAPTMPTITVKDTAGNVIPSTTPWTNKNMNIYVGGSVLSAGKGGIAYQCKMNDNAYADCAPDTAMSYTSIKTDTTFYARAYNTGLTTKISSVASRVLPKIERDNPTFSISIDSDKYEKSHTAILTFADTGGSALKVDTYTILYTWTTSATTPSSYDYSKEVTTTATSTFEVPITKDSGTGIYHLHVKLNKNIKDNATNECSTTTLTIPFYMDNTVPVVQQKSIESNPVALSAGITYSMDFLVTEEHSGLVTEEFTEEDIVIYVNGVESTATKTLTYKSVSNSVYEYNLKITNVTETGLMTMEIKAESIPDYATNKCVVTNFELTKQSGSNFIGPYADNTIPVVSMTGAVTLVSVSEDKNLSGIVDERYVNQYYTVEIPFRILDIGGQDFTDVLESKDLIVKAGTTEIIPSTKILSLNSENVTADETTKLSIYQKDYTLRLSGMLEDGFLELTAMNGAIVDLATNTNVQTELAPYTNFDGTMTRIFIDNTKPQPTIKSVLAPQSILGETDIDITLYIKELGSGIMQEQFAMSDMGLQVNGASVTTTVEPVLTPNSLNNYQTALGKDNNTNYTYDLKLSGIEENGTLRIQIVENNIIDKANNGNDSVTLDVNTVIDNKGPKVGPLSSNADKNGEVFGESAIVTVTDCFDPSGIARYEWQRSDDGVNFETIYTEDSMLFSSEIEDVLTLEKTYYYRVIVSDTLGNSTTSSILELSYRNTIDGKPTIRLSKDQISSTLINIDGVIKSKSPIIKIVMNGSEIPKSKYENNVKVNNYEITTTFSWPVTQNGVYEFTATDEKGNVAVGTINVNEFDFSQSIIIPEKKDATLLTPAQIIFTANEPVRIIDDDAYPGFTFDTDDFSTKIIATVSPDVDFDETKIFDFENKGLTPVEVPVEPPLITRFAYLRFASISAGDLDMTIAEMNSLTVNMRSAKVATSTGQIKSYYGFKNENVDTKISTQADISAAEKLGSATETYVISENGELVKLEKDEQINVSENGNYTNGNVTGMYQKTSGLLDSYSDILVNDTTIKYSRFRVTIVP